MESGFTKQKFAERPFDEYPLETDCKLQEINRIIHDAFHDIRSPLGTIKPYIDFLKKIDDKEKEALILCRMKLAVEKMEHTMSRFVQYTNLISEHQPKAQAINFTDIVDCIKREACFRFPQLSKAINITCPADFEFSYPKKYIRSILNILLENAFQYRHHHRPLRINVSINKIDADCLIEVSDNGSGFPDFLSVEKAFIPFTKNVHPNRGVGLGLASLRHIVEKNKGEICSQSSADGTAFILRLCPYIKHLADGLTTKYSDSFSSPLNATTPEPRNKSISTY